MSGKPAECKREFKVPTSFDDDGRVITWAVGVSSQKIACGLNASTDGASTLSQTLLTLQFRPGRHALQYKYPKEEIAILEFDNRRLKLPSLPIRSRPVDPRERLTLLGYPGASVRDRAAVKTRLQILGEDFSYFNQALRTLKFNRLPDALAKVADQNAEALANIGAQIDSLPKDSVERKVRMFGQVNYLGHLKPLIEIWNRRSIDQACTKWRIPIFNCYLGVIEDQLINDLSEIKKAEFSILNELASDYPEADQSLRFSTGYMLRHIQTRQNFYGMLSTDVDAVSGYSGGPLVDSNGAVAGIASSGPSATSLTYKKREGVVVVSNLAISDLLNSIPREPMPLLPPSKSKEVQ